jgi:hypothetical protein
VKFAVRHLIALTAVLTLIAGCASQEQKAAQQLANDDAQCQSYRSQAGDRFLHPVPGNVGSATRTGRSGSEAAGDRGPAELPGPAISTANASEHSPVAHYGELHVNLLRRDNQHQLPLTLIVSAVQLTASEKTKSDLRWSTRSLLTGAWSKISR